MVNLYNPPEEGVTSLNGLTGDITLAAGDGITITPSGQTLTIATTADLSVTLADVSVNSTDATKSLYTMTSAVDVEFQTSGATTMMKFAESTGVVYATKMIIGASSGTFEALGLHIITGNASGTPALLVDGDGESNDTTFQIRTNGAGTGYVDADTKWRFRGDGKLIINGGITTTANGYIDIYATSAEVGYSITDSSNTTNSMRTTITTITVLRSPGSNSGMSFATGLGSAGAWGTNGGFFQFSPRGTSAGGFTGTGEFVVGEAPTTASLSYKASILQATQFGTALRLANSSGRQVFFGVDDGNTRSYMQSAGGIVLDATGTTSSNQVNLTSGGLVGFGVAAASVGAKVHIIRTTEQLRIGYDTLNYYSTTVGSTGGVTFNAVGSGSAFTFSDDVIIPRIGLNNSTFKTWDSGFNTIQAASGVNTLMLATTTGNGVAFVNNAYIGSGAWKFVSPSGAARATNISQASGEIYFRTSTVAGSADTNITWLEALHVGQDGKVAINNSASSYTPQFSIRSTTEQFRLEYSASNYFNAIVSGTGGTAFAITSDNGTPLFTFNKGIDVTGNIDGDTYSVAGSAGADGSFTTVDGKTVTVTKGLITSIF